MGPISSPLRRGASSAWTSRRKLSPTPGRKYGDGSRISFRPGTCSDIPLVDSTVDLVVSFETLEHHDQHHEMLREVKRVLRPGGMLVISTPDRLYCTILPRNYNPYHAKELFKHEFKSFLENYFDNIYLFEQKICHVSVMSPGADQPIAGFRHYQGDFRRLNHTPGINGPLFNLAVATDSTAQPAMNISLFEGIEIPTEVEKNLAQLHARLAEREAQIAALREQQKVEVAESRALLAMEELRFLAERSEIESRSRTRQAEEIESLRAELRAIAHSRAWRLAQHFSRSASALRKLRVPERRSR